VGCQMKRNYAPLIFTREKKCLGRILGTSGAMSATSCFHDAIIARDPYSANEREHCRSMPPWARADGSTQTLSEGRSLREPMAREFCPPFLGCEQGVNGYLVVLHR
jgi:hypothetical protein